MGKKTIIPNAILVILKTPLTYFLLNVLLPLIYGIGINNEYRRILILYFSLSLIFIIIYTIIYLSKVIRGETLSANQLFVFFPFLSLMLIAIFLYLYPYGPYLFEPVKFIQDNIPSANLQITTITDGIETVVPSMTPQAQTPTTTISMIPPENILSDSCISANKWVAYRDESFSTINNCWNIPGLVPIDDHLEFFVNDQSKHGTFGIFTPINDFSIVSIELTINQLNIPKEGNYARVFFGIVPSPNPHPNNGMMFFFQVESYSQAKPYIKYRNPNAINTNTLNEEIKLGETHKIDLILKDQYMNFFVDNHQMDDKFTLPENPDYFWIGFQVEDKGAILDVTIDSIVLE